MNDRLRQAGLTLAMIAVAAAIAAALRLGAKSPLPGIPPSSVLSARTRFQDLVVVGRANGQRAWEVRAPVVETDRASDRLDFTGGIHATLIQDGRERVACDAPTARYEASLQRLTAQGGVVARLAPAPRAAPNDLPPSVGALLLRTPSIVWSVGARTLDCPESVAISFDRGEARVDSLRLNLQTRALDCRRFRGRFLVKETDL